MEAMEHGGKVEERPSTSSSEAAFRDLEFKM